MGNVVTLQLLAFLRSFLLGLVAAALYDLLRWVRLRRSRGVTHALDALYVFAAGVVLLLFALNQGEGELRLFMLLGIFLGAVLYFGALAALFRPVWRLWVEIVTAFAALLWRPVALFLSVAKKFRIYIKKLFYFWRRYATIGK